QLARPLLDGAVDVLGGHVDRLGARDGGPQPGIRARIAAAAPRGDCDLFDVLGENLPALRVGSTLLPLYGAPLRMTGHGGTSFRCGTARSTQHDHAPGNLAPGRCEPIIIDSRADAASLLVLAI